MDILGSFEPTDGAGPGGIQSTQYAVWRCPPKRTKGRQTIYSHMPNSGDQSVRTPCPIATKLPAEKFGRIVSVARAISNGKDLKGVKAEYKSTRQELEQHVLACPMCHGADPF